MNAVLLAKYTTNADSLPAEWPVETRTVGDGETVALPWLAMSDEELAEHKAEHSAEKEAWNTTFYEKRPGSVKLHALRSVFGLRGFTTKIDRTINNLPEPNKTIAANHWNYGDEIRRDHPLVSALAGMLSLTDAEVDEIFRDSQTIMEGGTPDTKPEEATLWERLTSLFS